MGVALGDCPITPPPPPPPATATHHLFLSERRASELRKFVHFHNREIIMQFLLIFRRYFKYFVGTNDMVVSLACMYGVPTKLRKKH